MLSRKAVVAVLAMVAILSCSAYGPAASACGPTETWEPAPDPTVTGPDPDTVYNVEPNEWILTGLHFDVVEDIDTRVSPLPLVQIAIELHPGGGTIGSVGWCCCNDAGWHQA